MNKKTHIHNVLKDNQIIESVFRFKKIYSYLPTRKNTFKSKYRPRELVNIGLICLYCSEITFNQDYLDYKQHLQDQA